MYVYTVRTYSTVPWKEVRRRILNFISVHFICHQNLIRFARPLYENFCDHFRFPPTILSSHSLTCEFAHFYLRSNPLFHFVCTHATFELFWCPFENSTLTTKLRVLFYKSFQLWSNRHCICTTVFWSKNMRSPTFAGSITFVAIVATTVPESAHGLGNGDRHLSLLPSNIQNYFYDDHRRLKSEKKG